MQTFPFSDEEFDPQKVLTLEQATEDVDYLFTVFHDTYPLYDYFGGEEAFTAAREKILADCAAAQPLTGEVLVESMIAHLNFVEDGHVFLPGDSFCQNGKWLPHRGWAHGGTSRWMG